MAKSDHIEIPLTQGLITWISPEDADIAGWGWVAKQAGNKKFPAYYAMYTYTVSGVTTEYYLHSLVWERMMDANVPHGFLIDHINGDKLDNRRHNLRLATRSQNEQNKRKRRANTTSKYKGVVKIKNRKAKCWRVTLTIDGYNKHIGTFYSEKEAAIAYNQAAYAHFGEFALLNEIDEPIPANLNRSTKRQSVWYKQRYKGRSKGRPRKDPRGTQYELRKTGRSVGRPRKDPNVLQHDLRRTGNPPGRPRKDPRGTQRELRKILKEEANARREN